MRRFLLAYLVSFVLLAIVLFIHYLEVLSGFLGELYSEIAWKPEALMLGFVKPLFLLFLLQSILYFLGYFLVYRLMKKRNASSFNLLLAFSFVGLLGAILFLGLFEPILATDNFEYGVRQELNHIFELIGYARINVTVYIYLTLTAILTWFFVREKTNKSTVKSTPLPDNRELLDS